MERDDSPAFAVGSSTSSFVTRTPYAANICERRVLPLSRRPVTCMAEKKEQEALSEPKSGNLGSNLSSGVQQAFSKTLENVGKAVEKTTGKKLPVIFGSREQTGLRGFALLKEDLLKNAPEIAGVGRQDKSFVMKPQFGEPGYKPQAYETIKYSDLGISSFTDDPNAVVKVGGLEAVKEAAKEAKKGKSAAELKAAVLKVDMKEEKDIVYDIPDYLKPLPEDTPRPGRTWKNY